MLLSFLFSISPVFCLFTSAQPLPEPQPTYDSREASISSIHHALFGRLTTCRAVVSSYLASIETYNPAINAIMSLDPSVLRIADEKDDLLASGNATGRLYCIPILLKDNFAASSLNTTGGSLALQSNKAVVDAPTVRALRQEGAIILGKSSMHELALEGLSVSSLGGQVVNPYAPDRTAGGSSGGTGAAVAASFAVFGTGTDTVNSLRSPASANNLYSFRPTRGLISRLGVIPVSWTQDTVGAIGRNVADIATALTVLSSVGYDTSDNITALAPSSSIGCDYMSDLYSRRSLRGLRLGLVEGFFNRTASNETTPVNSAMAAMVANLTAAGVEVISVNDTNFNSTAIQDACDVQRFEFRDQLTSYLQNTPLSARAPRSMPELYAGHDNFLVIPSQYPYVRIALSSSSTSPTNRTAYVEKQMAIRRLQLAVHTTFARHSLSALIYPEQSNIVVRIGSPSQSGRNGILAAVTGFPVVTAPAGFSPPDDANEAPQGIPIGMELLGLPWSEGELLSIAQRIDDRMHLRRMPVRMQRLVEVPAGGYREVPSVVPNSGNIPREYPVGVLD